MVREDYSKLNKILLYCCLIISILYIGVYFLDLDEKEKTTDYNYDNSFVELASVEHTINNYSNVSQIHWDHMPIKFNITGECYDFQRVKIYQAFDAITNETDKIVSFEESNNAELRIYCDGEQAYSDDIKELGVTNYVFAQDSDKIIYSAKIAFHGQGWSCGTGYPTLEVHEILHAFAFAHNPRSSSIMVPYSPDSSKKCKIKNIDKPYLDCLKYTYSNGNIGDGCDELSKNVIGDNDGFYNGLKYGESEYSCSNGYYSAINDESSCCPYSNMRVIGDYCEYQT